MRPLGGSIRIPGNRDLLHCGWAHWLQVDWVVPIKFVHGDVIDANLGLVSKKTLADINGGKKFFLTKGTAQLLLKAKLPVHRNRWGYQLAMTALTPQTHSTQHYLTPKSILLQTPIANKKHITALAPPPKQHKN
jgi:hypothetical protein